MSVDVLLIDDDAAFSRSVRENFLERDLPLDLAESWEDGVALFRVGLHELVIADYNLPGSQHGLKLLATLKPLRPSTRLILISGAITSVPEQKIRSSGLVDEYLPKSPRLIQQLADRAQEAISRGQCRSDWPRVAEAHLAGNQMDEAKIEEIDSLLRRDI